MKFKRLMYALATFLALIIGLGAWTPFLHADGRKGLKPPKYVVDPFWPKPLPGDWVTGEVAGTCIDSKNHVFTVNRGAYPGGLISPEDLTATASPPVLEFNANGRVVNSWGNINVLPNGIHGCFVDYQDNVWIAGNGDCIVQKYSHDGVLLRQIGTRGVCDTATGAPGAPGLNSSHTLLNQPADIAVDPKTGDVYVADGYGNTRVVVFDKNLNYLRQWGSPGTAPGQFSPTGGGHPHCVVLSNDGDVYACDRANDRIQVFDKFGVLKRVIPVVPGTGTSGLNTAGSAWDVDFSPEKAQSFMFEADGGNEVLWIFDRVLGDILSGFGRAGHMAGNFTFLHTVAVDSNGNLFTGETIGGRRLQKFVQTTNDQNSSNDNEQ